MEIKDILGNVTISGEYKTIRLACEQNKSNLYDTDLRGSDLRDTNLRGANLCGAKRTLSDNTEIKFDKILTIMQNKYFIIITTSHIEIECKRYLAQDWWKFKDEDILEMDNEALDWWKKWKPIIQKIYNTKKHK